MSVHERKSVLFFFFLFLNTHICFVLGLFIFFSSKLGWTDTYGVGTGDIIAEYIKKHMIESRSYSTRSPHQVWT